MLRLASLIVFTIFVLAIHVNSRVLVPVGTPSEGDQNTHVAVEKRRGETKATETKTAKRKSKSADSDSAMWDIDGHKPPPVVLRFVEHPTKKNARLYLEWTRKRAQMLDKAIKVLAEVEKEEEEKRLAAIPPERVANTMIIMFFSPTCPHCLKELGVIERIKKRYPEVGLILYPIGDPDMAYRELESRHLEAYMVRGGVWKRMAEKVTAVPFLILADKLSGRVKAQFTGETSYERILESM